MHRSTERISRDVHGFARRVVCIFIDRSVKFLNVSLEGDTFCVDEIDEVVHMWRLYLKVGLQEWLFKIIAYFAYAIFKLIYPMQFTQVL